MDIKKLEKDILSEFREHPAKRQELITDIFLAMVNAETITSTEKTGSLMNSENAFNAVHYMHTHFNDQCKEISKGIQDLWHAIQSESPDVKPICITTNKAAVNSCFKLVQLSAMLCKTLYLEYNTTQVPAYNTHTTKESWGNIIIKYDVKLNIVYIGCKESQLDKTYLKYMLQHLEIPADVGIIFEIPESI